MKRGGIDVLFLGHEASRTGAPILLLRILHWIHENTDLSCAVILAGGGALESEYRRTAKTWVFDLSTQTSSPWLARLIRIPVLRRVIGFVHRRLLGLAVRQWNPTIIYANTCVVGHILDYLSFLDKPAVTHVHELEVVIRTHVGAARFAQVVRHSNRFVAVSQAVRRNLIANQGIADEKIELIPEFLTVEGHPGSNLDPARRDLRQRFGLPEDAFVVGASGSPGWRKGSDLFVQLAGHVVRRQPEAPVYFIWIGGPLSEMEEEFLKHDCRGLGAADRVHFVDTQPDPSRLFMALDVFAMVSREDPYPLVTIEVAAMAVPIVCFDQAGGSQELVEEDGGFVVPYLDTLAMADRVLELASAPELRERLGNRVREKVIERNDAKVVMPLVVDLIGRMIAISNGPDENNTDDGH